MVLMPFVLDTSVAMTWCFEDETAPYADQVLELLRADAALAPAIWSIEVANATRTAECRGRLAAAALARLMELLKGLPISVENAVARAMGSMRDTARAYGLTSYDALYLELAMREGLPLATQDARLGEAATHAGVELVR